MDGWKNFSFVRHDEKLIYIKRKKPVTHTVQNSRKNRQRNIIWFNPPYSMNVQTNIGREFSDRHGLQQQKQAVPLVPHRKTFIS